MSLIERILRRFGYVKLPKNGSGMYVPPVGATHVSVYVTGGGGGSVGEKKP